MGKLYAHFEDYTGPWPWPNFTPEEISCPCCGEMYLDTAAMGALQRLCEELGEPVRINSGHRCAVKNEDVGGVEKSMHRKIAFDCHCPKDKQPAFVLAAINAGFTGIGSNYRNFVHVDMGRARRW